MRVYFSAFSSDNDTFDNMYRTVSSGLEWRGEVQATTRSGNKVWTNAVVALFLMKPAKLYNTFRFQEDISQVIKLNEAYREAKEKAEESSKLKTAFLQNISHEIRTTA